jgi:hypothetical protein
MSAEFRAPDPVRAHLNTAWLDRPLPAGQRRIDAPERPRPREGKRAVGATALALLAPALALAALIGFGTVDNGVSQSLGSIQGAVGLTGSAETGDLTADEPKKNLRPDRGPAQAKAAAPVKRTAPALKTPKPKPTGPNVIPVNRPAPVAPVAPAEPTEAELDDDHGQGGSGSGGSGSGSGTSGP